MEIKQLKIEEPVRLEGLTILPISQISLYTFTGRYGIYLTAIKKALAVILFLPSRKAVYTFSSEEVTLEHLQQQLPGLDILLHSLEQS